MKSIVLLLLSAGIAGCAAGPLEPPPGHPANPASASAPAEPAPDLLALSVQPQPLDPADATAAAIVRAHAAMGKSAAETHYECPMHPEVKQAGEGICPECKMDLVVMPGKLEGAAKP